MPLQEPGSITSEAQASRDKYQDNHHRRPVPRQKRGAQAGDGAPTARTSNGRASAQVEATARGDSHEPKPEGEARQARNQRQGL